MSHHIQVYAPQALVVVRFADRLDDAGFTSYVVEMEATGPFAAGFDLLVVLEAGIHLDLNVSMVRSLARRIATFGPDAKRVVVAPADVAFGLSRVYSLEAPASDQYQVVRTIDQASQLLQRDLAHLGLSEP